MEQNYTLDVSPDVESAPQGAAADGSAACIPGQRADADGQANVVKAGRGRPSLGGQGRSPQVTFRAPPSLRAQAEERAARDGKTVSQLAREAFEMYLTS
ncbi:hypothetical protein ABN028_31230 [Actinopolymorpha sp. B17G11]|uniref:hypothetical protein n=1 Tax=unclassified Actinopolymorpha TaxID=2627063 RepID=UPI0032D9821D